MLVLILVLEECLPVEPAEENATGQAWSRAPSETGKIR